MDFELIEKHPWWSGGIALGGGLLIFLWYRSRTTQAAGVQTTASGQVYSATDPNQLAANTQLSEAELQAQTQVQLATISGSTSENLAGIQAGTTNLGYNLGAQVTNAQTSAQLQLGLGTLNAQTQQASIAAQVQLATIDALVRAFGGGGTPVTQSPGTPLQPSVSVPPVYTPTYTPPVNQYIQGSDPGPGIPNSLDLTHCTATSCPGPYSNAQFNYDAWLQQNQAWGTGPAPTVDLTAACKADATKCNQQFLAPVNLFPPAGQTVQPNLIPYAHY